MKFHALALPVALGGRRSGAGDGVRGDGRDPTVVAHAGAPTARTPTKTTPVETTMERATVGAGAGDGVNGGTEMNRDGGAGATAAPDLGPPTAATTAAMPTTAATPGALATTMVDPAFVRMLAKHWPANLPMPLPGAPVWMRAAALKLCYIIMSLINH